MIRTLLSTTALVALLATGAVAQDAAAPAAGADSTLLTEGYTLVDTDGLASKLLGFPVYTSAANDAERLGEINDIVIGEDGNVAAVILGVGGFLGVSEKNVAIEYDLLDWTTAEDNTERLVLQTTKEALNAAATVELIDDEPADTAAVDPAPAGRPMEGEVADDTTEMAAAPAPTDQNVDETETGAVTTDPNMAADPNATMIDPLNRDVLVDFDETTMTAEELTGVNVYGPTDEHIGVIGDFVLGQDGKAIDALIVDFGGFLGIGTKEVAVGYENLQFYADPNDNRVLVLNVTREQMEQAPAFNRDTYAAERDSQRLVLEPVAAS